MMSLLCVQMTIEMYPSDQVADLRAEVTHWYENLQKDQLSQQAQLQEFGQTSRQQDFPGLIGQLALVIGQTKLLLTFLCVCVQEG